MDSIFPLQSINQALTDTEERKDVHVSICNTTGLNGMPIFIFKNLITTQNRDPENHKTQMDNSMCECSLHLCPLKTQLHQAPRSPLRRLLPFPPPKITITWLLMATTALCFFQSLFLCLLSLFYFTHSLFNHFSSFNFICWRIQSIWPIEFYRETSSTNWKQDPQVWSLLPNCCVLLSGGL